MIPIRRRLRADLAQALALAASVLLVTTILAGAVMYLDTIQSLGLRSTLVTLSPSNRNLQVSVDRFPLTSRSISAATEQVDIALEELGGLRGNVAQESHTRPHYWALEPDEIDRGRASDSAILQRFEGFPDHVEFIDGEAPTAVVRREAGMIVAEAAVPRDRAEILGVNVGDDLWLASSPADPAYLKIRIVGRFEPHDLQEEFWFGLGFEAMEPPAPSLVARHPLPLFFAADSLFDLVTGGSASIGTNRWLVQLDYERLKNQAPDFTVRQIEAAGQKLRLGLPESTVVTAIKNRFNALREDIVFARIPTLMMGGVLLVAAGFHVATAAGALVARRRVDSGRLRARGVGRRQIALVYFTETLPLVAIPALAAPFLAVGIISLIGRLPEYELISFGSGMPVHLSWQAFVMSLLGGVFVLAFLQWDAWSGNRRAINSERLSSRRVEGRPFFQRQYFDLIFLLFGGLVLWDLSTEASVVSERTGQLAVVSKLLVFAPAIFLGVAVLFSLRVVPPIASLVSSGFLRWGPTWTFIVSVTFARLRTTYAWPVAILGMTAGAAVLSTTVAATLERSAADQAGYEAGADLRALDVDFNSGPRTKIVNDVRGLDGVAGASIGLRTVGGLRGGGRGASFDFLAVEPEEFAEIGVLRSDYASLPLDELLVAMEPEQEAMARTLQVAESATRVGVRLKSSISQEFVRASLRLLDAEGRAWSVDLGAMTGLDWQVRSGDVPAAAARPVEVVGIAFFEQANDELGTPMRVQIDDLFYGEPGAGPGDDLGTDTVFESFDAVESWRPLASSKGVDSRVEGFEYLRGGDPDRGLLIDLGVGTNRGVRGVIWSSVESVPALFSVEALARNGLSMGDETVVHVFEQSVPIRVEGVIEYFPTLDPGANGEPGEGGFVVADANQLWSYLSMSSFNSAGFLAELFVGLDDPADTDVISNISAEIGGIHGSVNREELRKSSLVTPLAIAGWRGAAIVTSTLAIVFGLFGFVTFVPVRPSSDQFNIAVLNALGMSRRGLVLVSVAEQAVVLGVGIAAGLGTGLVMARVAVGATTQTVANGDVFPPILFSTNWNYLVGLVGTLIAVAIVVTVWDVISVRRLNLAIAWKGSESSG